ERVRLQRRYAMLHEIDKHQKGVEDKAQAVQARDVFYEKAHGLITSPAAKKAFDLGLEPDKLRDAYGRTSFGQSCLLARRLIEAGTRFVEVNWPKVANSDNHSWDVHTGLVKRMREQAAPMLDAALSALLTDLDQRGLLSETLV